MKNSTYLIILLALGLVFVSYKWIRSSSSQETPTAADAATNAAIENIMTRTSVRSYTDREVTKEQVDTLLRAAMAAPTARNSQPWRFLVIDKKETLGWIAENFNSMTMAKEAAVAIVMCGDIAKMSPNASGSSTMTESSEHPLQLTKSQCY